MMKLGRTAKYIRKKAGLTQRDAAARLGITNVHLCNVERNHTAPSSALRGRYEEVFGVDLYITAWLLFGDVNKLPPLVRAPTRSLAAIWAREWDRKLKNNELGEVK